MFGARAPSGGTTPHLSAEDILLYLDGELAAKPADAVHAHLRECWECRARARACEEAVASFMDERAADLASAGPPPRIAAPPALALPSPARSRRPWAIAAAAAGAAFAAYFYLGGSAPPTVFARDVLVQAERQEAAGLRQVKAPVVYRKLRLRKPAGPAAVVEVWSDRDNARTHQQGDAQSWREFENVYRGSGFRGEVLSPASFIEWRDRLPDKRDEVARAKLDDGSDAFRLRTSARDAHGAGEVRATLLIRARDWRPVEQQLSVPAGDYNVTELAYQVLPLASVAVWRRQAPRPPPVRGIAPPDLPAPEPPGPDVPEPAVSSDDAEAEVHYILHRLGACRGEEVTVERAPSNGLRVRGIADSVERKQELQSALAGLPGVELDLGSADELSASPGHAGASLTERSISVRGGPPAIEEALKRHFAGDLDGGVAASVQFASRGLQAAQAAMVEAWALRRLAEQFGPRRGRNLRGFSASLLAQAAADHHRELAAHLALLRDETAPVLATVYGLAARPVHAAPAGDWAQEGLRAFDHVRRIAAIARETLAGDRPVPADDVQELLDLLTAYQDPRR